jgi:hypothetical protein
MKFPHIKGHSDGIGCKVIYEEGLPNKWGNAQIFNHIWGGRNSYMTLHLIPSEFPYKWGKFDFLFINVRIHVDRTILAVPFYCSSFFVTFFGAGGRTRLHLIDFGCCERTKTTGGSITQAHTHAIHPREKIRHWTIVKNPLISIFTRK